MPLESKKKNRKAEKPFKPKNHKELVDWYLVQIESGVATKRDFVKLAAGIKPVKAKKKAPVKKPKKE